MILSELTKWSYNTVGVGGTTSRKQLEGQKRLFAGCQQDSIDAVKQEGFLVVTLRRVNDEPVEVSRSIKI